MDVLIYAYKPFYVLIYFLQWLHIQFKKTLNITNIKNKNKNLKFIIRTETHCLHFQNKAHFKESGDKLCSRILIKSTQITCISNNFYMTQLAPVDYKIFIWIKHLPVDC